MLRLIAVMKGAILFGSIALEETRRWTFGVQRCGITFGCSVYERGYVACHVAGKFADITVGLQSAGLVVGTS